MILFYLHFNEEELHHNIAPLLAQGYDVRYHSTTHQVAKWEGYLPDVVILSLDRLPSHAKAYAEWIREAKKRQHIPLLFAGGSPEKAEDLKGRFSNSYFCATQDLAAAVAEVIQDMDAKP